jgi:hypothetical protein
LVVRLTQFFTHDVQETHYMIDRKTQEFPQKKKIWTAPAFQIIELSSAANVGRTGQADGGSYPNNHSA